MGASKRTQMPMLASDWPDQIWTAVCAINGGKGAAWKLAVAALAITGARPAELEHGITFSYGRDGGRPFMQATIVGAKVGEDRGQPLHVMRWFTSDETHRPRELEALTKAMLANPDKAITIRYDAEAISTRLRELSKQIWPRRRHAITGYCYRHLLSATAKAAGVDREELAQAMGHRSAESAGRYARAGRIKTGSKKPWASVRSSMPVKMERAPMARFKAAAVIKKRKLRRQP